MRLDIILQKYITVLAPVALICGISLGTALTPYIFLVPWFFALMAFTGSLQLKLKELQEVLRHPIPLFTCIFTVHFGLPFIIYMISQYVFDQQEIILGLLLIAMCPIGSTSLIWVSIYKGNVSLSLAIIFMDTILAPLLIPWVIKLFASTQISLNPTAILINLVLMILVPAVLALGVTTFTKYGNLLNKKLAFSSKLCILGILAVNGSSASPYFADINWQLIQLLGVVFLTCCLGYTICFCLGKLMLTQPKDIMTFTLCGGLRNLATGTVIAMSYFSPLTALTVALSMLFQQVLASGIGYCLKKHLKL